jgi:hypothetical protein
VRKDVGLLYDRVLPLLSFDKLDFYILLEPHKLGASYLLDDMLITEWWLNKQFVDPQVTIADIERLLRAGSGALVYTDRQRLADKINILRQKTSQYIDARARSCAEMINKEYATFEKTNQIDGLGPVLPLGLAAYYASEPGLKLLQDELRYVTFGMFRRLESSAQFDVGGFNELANLIGDYLHATGSDRSRVMRLVNANLAKQISPTEKVNEIKIFVNSTMFMYTLMTKSEVDSMRQKNSMFRPDVNNIMMYNIQKNINEQHKRLLFKSSNVSNQDADIGEILRSLDVSKLDDDLRQSLLSKLNSA